jgi:hypothetical protein
MKKKIFTFVLFLFLSNCATEENYKKMLDSWMTAPESSLVGSWGAP